MNTIHILRLRILLGILLFASSGAVAQLQDWQTEELGLPYHSIAYYAKYKKQLKVDTIKLEIRNAADAQTMIDLGFADKITLVNIANQARPNLREIFETLSYYPLLTHLNITDREFPSDKDKPYQLPDNIDRLKHLKSFGFNYTDKIDMIDALTKLSGLKTLRELAFTEYGHQLPAAIVTLKQIKAISLNTVNIGNNDLGKVRWQWVKIWGDHIRAMNYPYAKDPGQEAALKKVADIKSLQHLELSLYHLEDTAIISRFIQIHSLSFWGMLPFNMIIEQIGKLSNLEQLAVHDDYDINPSLAGLAKLTKLNTLTLFFSGFSREQSQLHDFNALRYLKNLKSLSVFGSNIGSLPDVFNDLPMLEAISLEYNKITEVPKSLFDLPALEKLSLSGNKIADLPNQGNYGCENLKELNIANNALFSLPGSITRLKNLQKLDAHQNHITIIPDGWENLDKLKTVDLSDNKLMAYPAGLQNNPNVENVSVYNNSISHIAEIRHGRYQIKSLVVSANPLSFLPDGIGNYTDLERLDASNLNLQALPVSLGDCHKLKALFLSSSIKAPSILPIDLRYNKELERLDLSGDSLLDKTNVFEVILATSRNNFSVALDGNGITMLPSDNRWDSIKFLDLSLMGNHLKNLPSEFAKITLNRGMVIRGNSMKGNRAI